MYLGVDIGGTKTLVAVLDEHGTILEQNKLPTAKNYDHWLLELRHTLAHLKHHDFRAGGVGMPATMIDRKHGRGLRFGNLPWRNVPIQADIERLVHCPIVLENDAKMGALSEAMLLKSRYSKVLYITVSTGIGLGFVADGQIDTSIGDGGGRAILLDFKGKMTPWEDFAGGRAIVARYGKKAMDINDEASWRAISRDLAQGLIELIAIMQPEVIVFGGSVGVYFDRFGSLLAEAIKHYEIPQVTLPKLAEAQRPELAVIYGCYDLAKQKYGHAVPA